MAIKMMAVKCPECGADLSVENGRDFFFCSYCGAKTVINNENEYIFRNIDEAKVREVEMEQAVIMRQMDMEGESNNFRKVIAIVLILGVAFFMLFGMLGFLIDKEDMAIMCIMIGANIAMWGAFFFIASNDKKKKNVVVGADDVLITESMEDYEDKNFNSVAMLFKSAGFTNVKTIALNDLNERTIKKNGRVESVTIKGNDEFEQGDVFPKTSPILITYHSKSNQY